MKHTTRWRPDTCDCVIEYEWDDTQPAEEREHVHKKTIPCEIHKGTELEVYETVKEENTRKNKLFSEALKLHPELEVKNANGEVISHDLDWSFNEERKVILNSPKLTTAQNESLQTAVDNKLIEL